MNRDSRACGMGGRRAAPLLVPLLLAGAMLACAGGASAQEAGDIREAYVTTQLDNAVDVVDLAAGTVVARIPVDGAPAGIALSPDRRTAYVTRPEGHGLAVIDLSSRTVVETVALPGGPLGIGVNPVSGAVYVADWYGARIFVLTPSPQGLTRTGEIAVGKSPSGIAVTPDGSTILVANREANSVSVVDVATAQEVAAVPVGEHPFGLTLSADGHRAYTANVVSDDVSAIDVRARREVGRVRTGKRPYVVALAQGRGFVTDQYSRTVSVFDLATLKPVGSLDVGDHPEGIATARDGRTLYVANWGDNTLSVLDARSLTVLKTIPTGNGPRAFGDFLR